MFLDEGARELPGILLIAFLGQSGGHGVVGGLVDVNCAITIVFARVHKRAGQVRVDDLAGFALDALSNSLKRELVHLASDTCGACAFVRDLQLWVGALQRSVVDMDHALMI